MTANMAPLRSPHGDSHADRRPARFAGKAHNSGISLDQEVQSGPVFVRAVGAEAGDRAGDDPGIYFFQCLIIDLELFQHPGAEIVVDHVGDLHQVVENFGCLGVAEIQGDGLFVPVQTQVVSALAFMGILPDIPAEVPAVRVLDLDDLGAQIPEDHGPIRPGNILGKIQDSDPF